MIALFNHIPILCQVVSAVFRLPSVPFLTPALPIFFPQLTSSFYVGFFFLCYAVLSTDGPLSVLRLQWDARHGQGVRSCIRELTTHLSPRKMDEQRMFTFASSASE